MANVATELGKLVTSAGVSSAYGEQQDVDGVRVIPVAIVGHAFAATEESADGANKGGGAGWSAPIGAYIRRGDDIRFEPNTIAVLVAAVPFVWVASRGITRIIRALKKKRR